MKPSPQSHLKFKICVSGAAETGHCASDSLEKAKELGVAGWVKNMPDGTVEALLEGDKPAIEQMIAWCGQGSSGAQVEKVKVEWRELEGCEGFEVKY